jgi:hypothetical protein
MGPGHRGHGSVPDFPVVEGVGVRTVRTLAP